MTGPGDQPGQGGGSGWSDRLERLWAPHRLAYVSDDGADDDGDEAVGAGGAARSSCPFCRIPSMADGPGLVVARGESVYAVLNKHPYNPGHLMVVPYRHVAGLEDLDDAESLGLADFTRRAVLAIRAASRPHGFNVGLNLGGVAGGSLADHLHQHVVPRWGGDANFMTVIGNTKVMPQLLADTRDLLASAWT